jgi:subtilisin-like proprotein convertase family protein
VVPPSVGQAQSYGSTVPFRIEDDDVVASSIDVPDLAGEIVDVDVRFNGLTHTAVQDLDIKLSNPSQIREVVLMSDVGSGPVTDVSFSLSDEASVALPTSGGIVQDTTYQPRNVGTGDAFFSPDVLSAFDGGAQGGRWILTISDDEPLDSGSLRNWELIITLA